MIRLALTDLDDTLIPFGASSASAYSVAAVHTLLDTGLHFGPVTVVSQRDGLDVWRR
jgi:hydroxymethylpyrimidine pyrophosphatase-like HAD family hydrolase